VIERGSQVGGHARTVRHRGFLFDVGGHRFFTKIPEVEAIWREIMGRDFLKVSRRSRILYRGRFYHYPLRPLEALRSMGPFESAWVLLSYLRKKLFPFPQERTLDEWMSNRFGRRLYLMFFKTYTEKVWGVPCTELRADWAAQRIKSLTLWGALAAAIRPGRHRPRTLIDEFDYPAQGPGMLWERMACRIEQAGQPILLGREVVEVRTAVHRVASVITRAPSGTEAHGGTDFIASLPLGELVLALTPAAPEEIQEHARALRYRDFLTVALMLRRAEVFPDHWLYIHTPEVRVARIQNYKNWSAAMVEDPSTTCLGLEYFCTLGDDLWSRSDQELLQLARSELKILGFARDEDVIDGTVLRERKAYPLYDAAYRVHVEALRRYLDRFTNLQMVGRNGLHKYDNQDHAMLSALWAVRNIQGERLDVWSVNTEREYLEGEDPARSH
jgi:protoporphyrinogen oxidase